MEKFYRLKWSWTSNTNVKVAPVIGSNHGDSLILHDEKKFLLFYYWNTLHLFLLISLHYRYKLLWRLYIKFYGTFDCLTTELFHESIKRLADLYFKVAWLINKMYRRCNHFILINYVNFKVCVFNCNRVFYLFLLVDSFQSVRSESNNAVPCCVVC